MTARLIDQLFRVVDTNGVPLSGALLYVYEAGTSTPLNTYSDTGLTTPNANPIVSDSAGYFGEVFVGADDYKWILKDANGNTLETADNIEISTTPSFSLSEAVSAQTGTSYTLLTTDRSKLITLSNASSIAITIPQADTANFPDGWYCDINNKGAGTATLTPNTSTIDGLATYTMRSGETIRVVSDGTNYQLASVGGKAPVVNAQTGTTYTFVTGDREKLVTLSNASAVAVALPQANTTTFKTGWKVTASNLGVGVVTITPTTSTINGLATLRLTTGQSVTIISDGINYQTIGLLGGAFTGGFKDNRYYFGGFGMSSGAGSGVTADLIRGSLFMVTKPTTFTRIGVHVSATGTATVCRLGIYAMDGNGVPETLILDAGTVNAGSTGEKEITISQKLDVGTYCITSWFDGSCSVYVQSTAYNNEMSSQVWGQVDTSVNTSITVIRSVLTYTTAYPSTFPTATLSYATDSSAPAIWLRKV